MVITKLKMIELPEGLSRVACPERSRRVEGLAYVYILYCRNDSFYTGHTRDLRERIRRHAAGNGARLIRLLKSFQLVYVEGPMPPEEAVDRERQLKKWSRAKKFTPLRRLHHKPEATPC